MSSLGLHTPPISNMVETEELILLHSVSKATLPTKIRGNMLSYKSYVTCVRSPSQTGVLGYKILVAISQAIELYSLAVFSLLFCFS